MLPKVSFTHSRSGRRRSSSAGRALKWSVLPCETNRVEGEGRCIVFRNGRRISL